MVNDAKEQMLKYNKVKKALFSMKDKAKAEIADANHAGDELAKLTKEYESVITENAEKQKSSSERERVLK